jgi:hypothetical protein
MALNKTKATYVSNRELEDLIRMETQKRNGVSPSPRVSMRSSDYEIWMLTINEEFNYHLQNNL